ncbi:hypothetical protein [Photobacterium lipolyticum]|uniref:hypothetical protein n=1 Tax=Photobacterium lipolyticum TaxID=266810 RepID=UPI001472C75C|nr:hypothetical protein [Photobacterium lipolyticum]
MADFTESMRLKGKAAEDIYFAELNRKLIDALHEKQAEEQKRHTEHLGDMEHPDKMNK